EWYEQLSQLAWLRDRPHVVAREPGGMSFTLEARERGLVGPVLAAQHRTEGGLQLAARRGGGLGVLPRAAYVPVVLLVRPTAFARVLRDRQTREVEERRAVRV